MFSLTRMFVLDSSGCFHEAGMPRTRPGWRDGRGPRADRWIGKVCEDIYDENAEVGRLRALDRELLA